MADASGTPARARPGVVTTSSWLLIFVAAIHVVSLILTVATINTIREVLRDAYRGTSMEQAADYVWVFGLIVAILTLLLAVALVVLAMLNNRGRNGARITTWVLGGILVCCSGGSLVNSALGGMVNNGSTSGNVPSSQEIQRRLDEALPGWYGPVTTLLGVVSVLALLAALILLALPAANEFFRKPQQAGWEPPLPGAAWPTYPQTPGYPSAPTDRPGSPPGAGERREPEPPPGS